MQQLTCFKAYDIRGRLESEINPAIAYQIGRAMGIFLQTENPQASTVVVGGDVRLTSEALKQQVSEGLTDCGLDVIDLGMTGTEEVYFATRFLQADGGVEVTASHNPIDFNGMKMVRREAQPISNDSGLLDIKHLAEAQNFPEVKVKGRVIPRLSKADYIQEMLSFVDMQALKPLKLVVNAGNGAAGPIIDAMQDFFEQNHVPISFIKIHHEPDGHFPNGIPNPILPELRQPTIDAVIQEKADMGIAWDGDFDRCFLFDEKGQFIEGYYIVGLLTEAFLKQNQGEIVIHDPRLYWNTQFLAQKHKGQAVVSKTGHAFIKEKMRQQDAIYGGEMSAHHYFRDFGYCDSGMIPWLLVAEMLSKQGKPLSALIENYVQSYPSSGEINLTVADAQAVLSKVKKALLQDAICVDEMDGLSLEFETWRFNLRSSNTEPVMRLNVESKQDVALMQQKTQELLQLMR
tara:strand:- start:1949 stop:3325 length:1377 start_codon:yes stop_codon:yes gene_type:complete